MDIAFINGEFIHKDKASISIFDRGFLFGDALYEVIPIVGGQLYAEEKHINRLSEGLSSIHITNPYTQAQWHQILHSLLNRNDIQPSNCGSHVYLQVSRGVEPTRTHRLPKGVKPTVVAFVQESKKPQPNTIRAGLKAITLPDPRRKNCNLKSTSLIANIMALHSAIEKDATEAIFIDDKGLALEGTQSNLFVLIGDTIKTPPLTSRILSGVTREQIIHILHAHNFSIEETHIQKNDLLSADEVWITGSIKGVYPIVQIDAVTIGRGTPGPIWGKVDALLKNSHLNAADTKVEENK